jgi:phosphoglucosamine mutase
MTKYPQVIINMSATPEQKTALKEKDEAKKLLLDYDNKLQAVEGRLLVRPSGTENLIRITMWGNDETAITNLANELKDKLGEAL